MFRPCCKIIFILKLPVGWNLIKVLRRPTELPNVPSELTRRTWKVTLRTRPSWFCRWELHRFSWNVSAVGLKTKRESKLPARRRPSSDPCSDEFFTHSSYINHYSYLLGLRPLIPDLSLKLLMSQSWHRAPPDTIWTPLSSLVQELWPHCSTHSQR